MTKSFKQRFQAEFPAAHARQESNGQWVVYSGPNQPLIARDTEQAAWKAATEYVSKKIQTYLERGITFNHIAQTGVSHWEIIQRAESLIHGMEERFGEGAISRQHAVDSVIDAALEHAQG